jgi:exopolysaccharide production protein ExoY
MPPRKTPIEFASDETERRRVAEIAALRFTKPVTSNTGCRRVIIIGNPADIPRALQHPASIDGQLQIVAVLAVDVESVDAEEGAKQLAGLLIAHDVETILVAGPVGGKLMRRVADLALVHQCELLAVMPSDMLAGHDPVVVWSGESPLIQLARMPHRSWDMRAKRAFDVAGSVLGLLLAAPVFALLALAIRLESPGGFLFAHERIGRGGRKFQCLKLRTMRVDAEQFLRDNREMYNEYRRNHYKIPDDLDPRITTLGRIVRRTSLDELPQLCNVLVGDMSLVGPRPVVEEELENYGAARDLLVSVRPGITGAWAVSGRHAVGYPQRCEIELSYVRRWTFWSDIVVLARTIGAVLNPGP